MIIESKQQYKDLTSQMGTTIVKLSTPTCQPCKMVAPMFKRLSEDFTDVTFCSLEPQEGNTELQDLASSLAMSVPTFLVYKDGELTTKVVGAHPYSVLKTKLGLED